MKKLFASLIAVLFSAAMFAQETPEVVGDPQVEVTASNITKTTFDLHFAPNSDAGTFYYVSGAEGTMAEQYAQFGAWMGFTCFEDLVKAWGISSTEEHDYTYTDMVPGTVYEVFVLVTDVNGTVAHLDTVLVTTLSQGGEGEAHATVTLGAYEITEGWWDDDVEDYVSKPSQMMTFTMNDQASCYRYNVVLAEYYDADVEGFNSDLQQDEPMPNMVGWFQYENLTTDFQIDPEVSYVVITSAKNSNGEWGPVDVFRATTPKLESAVDELISTDNQPVKMMVDGQVYILRGEHIYNMQGAMVK
ncbi:MAG: hypothetical protein MJZ82_02195 [Paludibacteraceae bacterium]|nr:hypothetical protein [Paludibacteraceae bacterium]